MRTIYLIALNTAKELLRNRLLYVILFFAVFLMGLMVALGQLSYTEQLRLTLGLGLPSIHICSVMLTIFVGGSLVYREIEKLTVLTLLSRAIGRWQFILGKYFGFLSILLLVQLSLLAVFSANMLFMGFEVSLLSLCIVFVGFFLEISLLLAATIFFSTFCGSFLAVSFAVAFFVIGHWIDNISELGVYLEKSHLKYVSYILDKGFPNLEIYNWRHIPLQGLFPMVEVFFAFVNCLSWVSFFIILSIVIFRRRDFA